MKSQTTVNRDAGLLGLSSRCRTILKGIGITSRDQFRYERADGKLFGDDWRKWRGMGYATMQELCTWAGAECPTQPAAPQPKPRYVQGRRCEAAGMCEKCGAVTHWQAPVLNDWRFWCGC